MTIRLETDNAGAPHTVWLDGTRYTLDELRSHIARSAALTTVVRWLTDERATTRRQRTLLAHWQRYGHRMQTTARTQAEDWRVVEGEYRTMQIPTWLRRIA